MQKTNFHERREQILARIESACGRSERDPESVSLMPVTKTRTPEEVSVAVDCGFFSFGENRIQEAVTKIPHVSGVDLKWEMIGHLQRNKAKQALQVFHRIQTVDSVRLASTISRLAGEEGKAPFPVLLQFNTGEDPAKYGFSVEEANSVMDAVLQLPHLKIEGLMTIAPLSEDIAIRKKTFSGLRELRDRLEDAYSLTLPELSMGMSDDLEEAVEEGSTLVRVGSALFGPRNQ